MIEQCARCKKCTITSHGPSSLTFDCKVNATMGSTYIDCSEFDEEFLTLKDGRKLPL
jgi:hypothetical protein